MVRVSKSTFVLTFYSSQISMGFSMQSKKVAGFTMASKQVVGFSIASRQGVGFFTFEETQNVEKKYITIKKDWKRTFESTQMLGFSMQSMKWTST